MQGSPQKKNSVGIFHVLYHSYANLDEISMILDVCMLSITILHSVVNFATLH